MKHGSLISPDEGSFGFGSHTSATVETIPAHGSPLGDAADFITVPDAHLLFSGEFKHSGNDLKIIGDDGKSFLVTDYFKTNIPPCVRPTARRSMAISSTCSQDRWRPANTRRPAHRKPAPRKRSAVSPS
jgi:hypothetical protein